MTLTNTDKNFGNITKVFHWLTALMIFTLIPLGILAQHAPFETSEQLLYKATLFSLHKTLGISLFFVAVLRILWAISQKRPAHLASNKPHEHFLAAVVHWLLYGSLVLVPLTGWVSHAATEGFAPIWWPLGQSLPFVPKDPDLAHRFAVLHMLFERVMVISIFLHIAGAVKHHFVDKDITLRRMWFGQTRTDDVAMHHGKNRLPLFAALAIWIVVLSGGALAGLFGDHKNSTTEPAALAQSGGQWAVQDGTIGITITQFGAAVAGEFAQWSANIDFDPTLRSGTAGTAEVEIAIASLTLGSVTDQALGADYFDATQFPTAKVKLDLTVTDTAYTATGTLTIRGTEQPLEFPFNLNIDGDTATVTAQTTLDRRAFGVGDTMTDPDTLDFPVIVDIAFTAKQ